MPPSPLARNATFVANTIANKQDERLNVADEKRHENVIPSNLFPTIQPTPTSTTLPSSSLVYYPEPPAGGLLGSGPTDGHTGVVIGVSCGLLGVCLMAVAYGFTMHVQRMRKIRARNTSRTIHDTFRLQAMGAQHHHRQQNVQEELAQQRQQERQAPTAPSSFSQWTPQNTQGQPRESVEEQLDDAMEMARHWKT
ncbi:hypothetical protein SPBR_05343 [Sporothrix brasiliensis 5110]|uniref:Uncharacterized protein n=1 Tax=Sporothrix brasiliensis 5110 TaxID=1398154 RepID=A0A0C2IE26_9PEZI|nr:uncharacterized protein SPBR_05343 [Sporothrix brasiliensis 5110]KIH87526.1 hypothetical protein SPBR_05343 [Sporothrix brasiliensis 5110]